MKYILLIISTLLLSCAVPLDLDDCNGDARCEQYKDRRCVADDECSGFPCIEGHCFVKRCTSDAQCPGLCGLHATPTPGFCTTIDIQ